ncbi:MAG: hypothetical protein FJY92_12430 [Candidatus Hydrogenedentes bacterium]|nr:hypothetical protein [Candidatus Hydrogenedentota bacterium]
MVVLKMGAGLGPYHAGPLVHFIDRNGLCDPLLARMDPAAWGMSGHNFREVPAGYAAYLEDGTTPITHPKIAEYYAMLETVVRGPIFTWERFDAIWKFHSGQMDSLLPRVWVPVDLAKLTPEQRLKWRELQLTRAEKDLISETGDSDAGIPPEDSTK